MKKLKPKLSKETVEDRRNFLYNKDKCLMVLFLNSKGEIIDKEKKTLFYF